MGKIITKDKIPLNNTIKKISVIQIKKKNVFIKKNQISNNLVLNIDTLQL